MIDRFGKHVIVYWSATELIWLQAAISLPKGERYAAYRDIAGMTGRTTAHVAWKAHKIIKAEQEQRKLEMAVARRRIEPIAPSQIAPISRERLMAGNGRVCRGPRTVPASDTVQDSF